MVANGMNIRRNENRCRQSPLSLKERTEKQQEKEREMTNCERQRVTASEKGSHWGGKEREREREVSPEGKPPGQDQWWQEL